MSEPRSSLSVTYFDPESEPMPEPMPEPEEPPKPLPKMGERKPTPKKPRKKKRKKLPVFTVWRVVFWGAISVLSVTSMYLGVQGWLGQSAAYIVLAVSTLVTAFFLDRDWRKVRAK